MTSLFNSLAEISSGYSVFEKDQILTESQLNSVSAYLGDQDRLDRMNLVGIGIICGFRVRLSSSIVSLGKGVGITTDGDLIRIGEDSQYDQFKVYDKSFPRYEPFYVDEENMLKVYELIEQGETDPLAKGLMQFATETGMDLSNMVALLLMESYIKDDDLCTGDDCDNHGQDYVSRVKLLLVEKSSVSQLFPNIQTSDKAARAIHDIVADRVLVPASLNSTGSLVDRFTSACTSMHARITLELPGVWSNFSFLLASTFTGDPTSGWVTRLNSINSSFSSTSTGIQYYYDFLKDIIDTWNEMRGCFFGESAWCCPDIDGFQKHLMLGNLVPTNDIDQNRLGFYPSPAVNRDDDLKQAIFLLQKIGSMIDHFSLPAVVNTLSDIRVTPSYTASQSLQNKSIPYYYKIQNNDSIAEHWNYKLHKRDMDAYNYSYHAATYDAQGPARSPLASVIDQNDFFRIEGHLGLTATSALTEIESQIVSHNLPFTVCTVLLGTDRKNVVDRVGAGYTDLNRLHYILRQDMSYKLDEVTDFSNLFKDKVFEAVNKNVVADDFSGIDGLMMTATTINSALNSKAASAKRVLNADYVSYQQDISWMSDIGDAMMSASQFQYQMNEVVNTSSSTSFDSFVSNNTVNWLPWIDKLIRSKDDKADNRKLFRNFVNENPGMEHTAGVLRGGTFILVYDTNGIVVADFMLSNYLDQRIEKDTSEPSLDKPAIPKGNVWIGGLKIVPQIEILVADQIDIFKGKFELDWNYKFDIQTAYSDALVNVLDIIKGGGQYSGPPGVVDVDYSGDIILEANVDQLNKNTGLVILYEDKLKDDRLTDSERSFYELQLGNTQKELAVNVENVAKQLDVSRTDVLNGEGGKVAMQAMNVALGAVAANADAKTLMEAGLVNVEGATGNSSLALGLNSMLKMF